MVPQQAPARILIVDDQPGVARVLANQLRLGGLGTLAVHEGELALAALAMGRIDLVISDVDMRPMSGVELLTQMEERGLHVPLLFLTGRVRPELVARARRSPFVRGVVQKPVFGAGLLDLVQRALLGPLADWTS